MIALLARPVMISERAAELGRVTPWSARDWQAAIDVMDGLPGGSALFAELARRGYPPGAMLPMYLTCRRVIQALNRFGVALRHRPGPPPLCIDGHAYRRRVRARRRRR